MLVGVILGLALVYSVSGHCNTFKNTEINIDIYKTNISKTVSISGCVERVQAGFNGETVENILVKDQKISRLNKDTARNMVKLRRIKFENCEIAEIDAEAFRNLPRMREIKVVKNKIRKFAGDTFGREMPLEILDLSENLLEELESFRGVDKLRVINFRSNLIENIPEDLFANCAKLEEINLASNKLSQIPANIFANTPQLRHIDIRLNKFTTLNFHPFVHLQRLNNLFLSKNLLTAVSLPSTFTVNKLDLAANFFNSLPAPFLQNLNVKFLLFTGNPLLCNCVDPIKEMLSRSGGVFKDLNGCGGFPVCVFPKISNGSCGAGAVDAEATKRFFEIVADFKPRLGHCYNWEHSNFTMNIK